MALWTFLQNILGAAGGTALVLLLAKYLGDRSLQRAQNAFFIGATSHMAAVAFDKHIGFCEEYVDAMSKALHTLIQEGQKEKPLDTGDFFLVRQKWALWLTREIENKLDLFELAISKIAAGAQFFDDNGSPVSNEHSSKMVIAFLRELLATEELTALRSDLVARSLRKSPHAA